MRSVALSLSLWIPLALTGTAASQQGKPKPYAADGVVWALSWEKATEEAVARNVPIHFHLASSADVCIKQAAEFESKGFVAASRNWVNVVGCKETHATTTGIVNGEKRDDLCTVYWGISCQVHVELQGSLSKVAPDMKNYTVPMSMFCDTTGKKLGEKVSSGSPIGSGEIIKEMDKIAKGFTGDKIPFHVWQGYVKARKDFTEGFEKGEWKRAMSGAKVLQAAKSRALESEGREMMNKMSEKGDELLKEAQDLLATDKDAARKLLKTISTDFKPLICANRAADFLKTIK